MGDRECWVYTTADHEICVSFRGTEASTALGSRAPCWGLVGVHAQPAKYGGCCGLLMAMLSSICADILKGVAPCNAPATGQKPSESQHLAGRCCQIPPCPCCMATHASLQA